MPVLKRSLLSALTALCVPTFALATQPCPQPTPPQPTPPQPSFASSVGTLAKVSAGGAMSIGSNGSALSVASSSQTAYAKTGTVPGTMSAGGPVLTGPSATITGETATSSLGTAYNTSTGAGTGWAKSGGAVAAGAQGNVALAGISTSPSSGSSGTQSIFSIRTERNQGGAVSGNTASGYQTSLSAGQGNGSAVQAATTGYVTGTNAAGPLANMNPAQVINIHATGYFRGAGQLGTGTIQRP